MAISGNDDLTPREREVLELLLRRWTNEEIAEHLVISVNTVQTRVQRVLHKLGHRTRRDLATTGTLTAHEH